MNWFRGTPERPAHPTGLADSTTARDAVGAEPNAADPPDSQVRALRLPVAEPAGLPPAPDAPVVADPFAAITPTARACSAILVAPPAAMTGVILYAAVDGAARAPGRATELWTVLVPLLVWAALVPTSLVLTRPHLFTPRASPGARTRRLWAAEVPPHDAAVEHRIGPMLAAFALGTAVTLGVFPAARWLAAHVDVQVGPGRALGDALGVVGALGVGVLAGALSSLLSCYALVGYLWHRLRGRRATWRRLADRAAAWLLRHAAQLLLAPWEEDTQAQRRWRVWRRLRAAADLLADGGLTPAAQRRRAPVAAALRALALAVDGADDAVREDVRLALLKAAPKIGAGTWKAALPVLEAAAQAAGVDPAAVAREDRSGAPAQRLATWGAALAFCAALGVLLLSGLLPRWWASWAPTAMGQTSAPFRPLGGVAAAVLIFAFGVFATEVLRFVGKIVLTGPLAAPVAGFVGSLRSWEPASVVLRTLARRGSDELETALELRPASSGRTDRDGTAAGAMAATSRRAPRHHRRRR